MVSAKLLDHLRRSEEEFNRLDRRGLQNHPFADEAFRLIQTQRQIDGGNYALSDYLPRGPSPKTQTISTNVLDATQIPYYVRPAVHPALERLERNLIGAPGVPRVYGRDTTVFNEWALPYDVVIWQEPLYDESDLHFVKEDAIRPKSIQRKRQQISPTVMPDYKLVPVLYAIPEPHFGNRLLEPRDTRNY